MYDPLLVALDTSAKCKCNDGGEADGGEADGGEADGGEADGDLAQRSPTFFTPRTATMSEDIDHQGADAYFRHRARALGH